LDKMRDENSNAGVTKQLDKGNDIVSNQNSPVDVYEDEHEDAGIVSKERIPGTSEETDASFFSRLLFFWARPLFRKASELHKQGKALEQDDLLTLPPIDHAHRIGPAFEEAWIKATADAAVAAAESTTEQPPQKNPTKRVTTSLLSIFGSRFMLAGLIKIVNTCLQFSFPLLLSALLRFFEDVQAGEIDVETDSWFVKYRGYWLSIALFLAMASKAVTENFYFQMVMRMGYQARVAVSVAVYDKAFRLASSERQGSTTGELVNLMQVDATKIEMFIPQIHVLWDGMLQIAGYMVVLYFLLGWPCFAGLVTMLVAGPMQVGIMKRLFGYNRFMVEHTDTRVKQTNEALQGIRCVKMYTWEDSFLATIGASRWEELKLLRKVSYLRGFSRAYMGALPGVVAVVSFVVYAVAVPNADIRPSTLFASLVAFNQLRFPLLFYPMALAQYAQAKVSAIRLEAFLGLREIGSSMKEKDAKDNYSRESPDCPTGGISIEKATIYWGDPTVPIIPSSSTHPDSLGGSNHSNKSGRSFSSKKNDKQLIDEEEETPVLTYPHSILRDLSLNVAPGELCAVVGRVGSGKSTLCSAVLNEAVLGDGKVSLNGSVAYASQSPWIMNVTLRDNILFGLPYDKEKYDRVLKACQLTHDLAILENGDLTEIGEKGINLSGGQKQRVSVARAAYSNADIIILDDPQSALDPEVGQKLFDECILDLMKGKTRLLVTNQLQCLKFCDTIIALGHGRVLEQGTYSDLTNAQGGEVQRVLNDLKAYNESTSAADDVSSSETTKKVDEPLVEKSIVDEVSERSVTVKPPVAKEAGNLVTQEERNVGAVKLSVYIKYLKAGGGLSLFIFVYFIFILSSGNELASLAWVSYWTTDTDYSNNSQAFYLGIYGAMAVSLGIITFARSFLLARFGVRASNSLHTNLLRSVLNAPMSFFDTTPTGRIISRFSKDMYAIDQELADQLDFFLMCSINVVVSLGTIVFVTPWFGVVVLPLMIVYIHLLNYFREVSRETKRLESISRSPVYAHFSETLGGLATIRAYGESRRFINDFELKIDGNTRANYCNKTADRWLSVRLELIGSTIAGLSAVFASLVVINGATSGQGSGSNFASLAGLSLTYSIQVTGILNWCVRTFAQLEAAMNSCERVLHYTENIPQEAASSSDALEVDASSGSPPTAESDPSAFAVVASGGKASRVTPVWPEKGTIVLNNLKMKYRSETPLVLKGLNVTIEGGQRIGVVGRTGSGKSSLLLSLLRIVEPTLKENPAEYEAPITIDGIDVLRLGLKDLRSKLGIIPQNPVLFSGTIRSNIDPFDECSDEQIWNALGKCGMKAAVEVMPDLLLAPIAEYGDNLSQGQRQLLCLGRALLKQCRVLLLDEATSSVDYETDREIQRTLREEFSSSTVLTIAHRVNTIMDSDKILVMKDGLAEEFASPEELLDDSNSLFSDIVRHAKAEQNAK